MRGLFLRKDLSRNPVKQFQSERQNDLAFVFLEECRIIFFTETVCLVHQTFDWSPAEYLHDLQGSIRAGKKTDQIDLQAHKTGEIPLYTVKKLYEGGRALNLEDQYDRIFRYLYFHLHDKPIAEDLTQETFLRFLRSRTYQEENRQLQYLYTIARNLCRQHYRDRTIVFTLEEEKASQAADSFEQPMLEQINLQEALQKLSTEDRELVFLHYVNDVPVSVISGMYKISRFAAYRKLKAILKKIKRELEGTENE